MARQWSAIDGRLDGRKRWLASPLVWASVAVLALGVGFGAYRMNVGGEVPAPFASAAPPADATKLALADGSEVTMAGATRIAVDRDEPEHVHLTLGTGFARFKVKPDKDRPFVVEAGEVSIRVVGTEFAVTRELDERGVEQVKVVVDHGIVEVVRSARSPGGSAAGAHPTEPRRLHAGEEWSTRSDAPPPEAEPSATVAAATPPPTGGVLTTARSLFESANAARRAGNVAAAAQHYRELVSRFPDDPRAKVAAFELGRLELEMGRAGEAEKSLEKAAQGNKGTAVHEDALAKLVTLYNGRGDAAACKRAKNEYLRLYPKGVHAEAVRVSCSSP